MAINIVIPKDITKYEAKLIGPLTTRQAICCIPAVILGVVVYLTVSEFAVKDMAMFACMIVAAPFILMGWFKPYGIPLEKFVKTVFITMVMAPKNRKYKTANTFSAYALQDASSVNGESETAKNHKKNTKFVSENPENISYK